MRGGPQGRHQTVAVQGIRSRMHARNATRCPYGLVRGRLRGVLSVWRREAPAQPAAATRGRRGMNIVPFLHKRPRGKVHVPTVTLAHGGGGKAMKDLIDDVFLEAFYNPLLAPLAR